MRPTLVLLAVLFCSCSLQAKITVGATGAATVESAFTVSPAAQGAWKGLRDLDATLPADPFDPALLRKGLGTGSQVSTVGTVTRVGFVVPDVQKLFPAWVPGADTWDLVLDRSTFRRLAALTSWGDSPALDSLVPGPTEKVTEAEYRDLLVYLLGPGTKPDAAEALIDGSTVQLTVVAPRTIKTAEGAVSVTDRTAVYRWPLVKALVLTTPLHLKITF
jgi:hypothetical protein